MSTTGSEPVLLCGGAEAVLQRAWSQALGGGACQPGDDFFAHGGDSLAALTLVAQIQEQTGLEVGTTWLYEHPRFADAAAALRTLAAAPDAGCLPPVLPGPRGGWQPLSFQQEGLLAVMEHVRGIHPYRVRYAVDLPEGVDAGRLRASVQTLTARHPVLGTRLSQENGTLRHAVDTGTAVNLEFVRPARQATVAQSVQEWAAAAIPLEGPLVRAALVGTGERRRLVLSAHQLITDPWSWGLLLRDIARLYTDPGAEGAPVLAYSDYARWQREHLTGPRYADHLGFWRRMAAGFPSGGVPMPGAPGHVAAAGPAARLPVTVTAPVAEALRGVARDLGASLFELLLALFHGAVGRWAGVQDVLVGSATASRTLAGTPEVAGFFVNGRFTRACWHAGQTVADLVVQVRETWRAGDAHRELHLEKTVVDLGLPDVVNVKFSLNAIPVLDDLPRLGGGMVRLARMPDEPSARRHVSVALAPDGLGLAGVMTYRTDVLPQTAAASLADGFGRLVQQTAEQGTGVRLDRASG